MPRPRNRRRIRINPNSYYYKPRGIPLKDLEEVQLSLEELEALRLKDYLQLDQKVAAEKMQISQPTFHRIIKEARHKLASAVVTGKAIRIEKN